MSKIQGKQISDYTIEQRNLNLYTPLSGDTTSGATVEYTNNYIKSISGATVIGPPEDDTYTDGIFKDFTDETRIGVAVDRFNEMFLLLAPQSPTSWESSLSDLSVDNTKYSPRILGAVTTIDNMITSTTPTPTVNSLIGTGEDARIMDAEITLKNNDTEIYNVIINEDSTSKTTGYIRYNIGDPYEGESGKSGFWTGVTLFSLNDTLPEISPGIGQNKLSLDYPSTTSPLEFNYYVDDPLNVSITNLNAYMPSEMEGKISGVPTLTSNQKVTGITFEIENVSSYFWAPDHIYQIYGDLIDNITGDPDTIPTESGETGSVAGKEINISNGVFSDFSFSFLTRGRNSILVYGTSTGYNNSSYRVDTISDESIRLTSGIGEYPGTGWGGTYDSNISLLEEGNYENELQLKNGEYVYPENDYSNQGGPNYSTASGTRYVTFNIGNFNDNSAFNLGIDGDGITSIEQDNLRIEVKISGATYWVDGGGVYSGTGDPGSSEDGAGAVVYADSEPTVRRITFGSITYTGPIMVRIGTTDNSITINSLSAANIV